MVPILQKEAAELRKISVPIAPEAISSLNTKKLITRLKKALSSQDDGVAIAAPQIGENVRVFVVSGRTLAMIAAEKSDEKNPPLPDLVFINPEITKRSKKMESMEEGCLSVRYLYGSVKRATKVTVQAYDEHGKMFTRGGAGLLAQIFQHEIDHLDGVLFTDKAENVKDIPPEDEAEK